MTTVEPDTTWTSALRERPARFSRAGWAVVLALLLHLLFLALLLFLSAVHLGSGREPLPRPPPQAVTLRSLSSHQWAQNRMHRWSASTPPAPPRPKPPPQAVPKGQVVDVAPGNDQESPDAQYLAEHSNTVQHQTRSRQISPFYRNAMPRSTTTLPQAAPGRDRGNKAMVAGNNGLGTDDRPVRSGGGQQRAVEIPDVKPRARIALREPSHDRGPGVSVPNQTESDPMPGNSDRLDVHPGSDNGSGEAASQGHRGAPGIANLAPSVAMLDKIDGAAPNDHLDDVDPGDGTFLNTKEWKYASFFNRVKQAVGMHWDPTEVLRTRDPTLNIYGGRDRYTVLNITLNERGTIKEIHVEKSCGVDFLDSEAIAAFERSQPFPNPPSGLLGADAAIHFSFGFFLEMGGGPRLRLFRAPN